MGKIELMKLCKSDGHFDSDTDDACIQQLMVVYSALGGMIRAGGELRHQEDLIRGMEEILWENIGYLKARLAEFE